MFITIILLVEALALTILAIRDRIETKKMTENVMKHQTFPYGLKPIPYAGMDGDELTTPANK